MDDQFTKFVRFLEKLEACKIFYKLDRLKNDFVLVQIAVPGERWEVKFFVSDKIEVEVFRSDGEIRDESALGRLFAKCAD